MVYLGYNYFVLLYNIALCAHTWIYLISPLKIETLKLVPIFVLRLFPNLYKHGFSEHNVIYIWFEHGWVYL